MKAPLKNDAHEQRARALADRVEIVFRAVELAAEDGTMFGTHNEATATEDALLLAAVTMLVGDEHSERWKP